MTKKNVDTSFKEEERTNILDGGGTHPREAYEITERELYEGVKKGRHERDDIKSRQRSIARMTK